MRILSKGQKSELFKVPKQFAKAGKFQKILREEPMKRLRNTAYYTGKLSPRYIIPSRTSSLSGVARSAWGGGPSTGRGWKMNWMLKQNQKHKQK